MSNARGLEADMCFSPLDVFPLVSFTRPIRVLVQLSVAMKVLISTSYQVRK